MKKSSLALVAGLMFSGALTGQSLDQATTGNETMTSASPRVTLGTNLFIDPCTGCYYNSSPSGYAVIGPDNCDFPDQVEQLAVPFIAAATGAPSSIEASLILYNPDECPENEVTLSINSDLCYPIGPGHVLASGRATVPTAPCDLTVAKLRNAPTLTQGTKYWVVAKPVGTAQASLEAVWYASNNAPLAENHGAGWQARAVRRLFE